MSNLKKSKKEEDDPKERRDNTILRKFLRIKLKTLTKILLVYFTVGPGLLYGVFLLLGYCHSYFIETHLNRVQNEGNKPKFWIYCKKNDTSHLKHVYSVLERLGFEKSTNESDWDLLWAHDYPFNAMSSSILKNLKPHQRVNHFPGCGYVTNKVDLSTSKSKYLPAAFKIPHDRESFNDYIQSNPNKTFVEKSNDHRGIGIKRLEELNFSTPGSFVQEFIDRPFLVDGYKFDIGVYTVVTSINPLRVYTYKGDVLFRFCPVKYYPFDPKVLDKYVVGDDYLPIWEVPSLKLYYTKLGFSMKDSFNAYIRSIGENSDELWDRVNDAIREIILSKEESIKSVVSKRYGNGRNFFELMRFDFTIDEDLNVFMMEANMSPNLSSAHYPPNQLLYEQVLFNMFALIGLGSRIKDPTQTRHPMEVAVKNLVVLPDVCSECDDCFRAECLLCNPCFTPEFKETLTQSYLEHHNKMDYQRIFPPPVTKDNMILKDYTFANQLLTRWYQGKCEMDRTWCM